MALHARRSLIPWAHEMCDSFPLPAGGTIFFQAILHAALSSMASAKSRVSRVFSSFSVVTRLAFETSIPPNLAFHLQILHC